MVKEALNLAFNIVPIAGVDFYASAQDKWWGVSVQLAAFGPIGALLGAFTFISQLAGFPPVSAFKPRFSIAGKLSGKGLPITLGLDYAEGDGDKTKWLTFCANDGDCPGGYKCLGGKGLGSSGGICAGIKWWVAS